MAIQPIDLQTLFTQVDKVARQQSAQRDGLAMQQIMHGVHLQRKTEEQIQSVNEAQNIGDDGIEHVKDRDARDHEDEESKQREQEESDEEEGQSPVIRDPRLGRNIDISL